MFLTFLAFLTFVAFLMSSIEITADYLAKANFCFLGLVD